MSNTSGWSMCQIICWLAAVVAGLIVVWLASAPAGFIAALLIGAALALLLGLVLTRLACASTGQSAVAADAIKDAGAKTKDAATSTTKKAGSEAADKAKGAAEKAGTAAKDAAKTAKAAVKDAPGISEVGKKGTPEGAGEGVRPEPLSAPRDGKADNLKEIKGIGPKLETVCNEMGFYHFDQIAAWNEQEVAWVDANLKGFRGRVTRDKWVEQAKILAAGGETEFSKRVEDGEVY